MLFSRFIPRPTPHLPPYGAHNSHPQIDSGRRAAPPDAITPYLGLRSRLSQVWINKWTILILLILVRLLIAVGSINHDLGSAERESLSACTSVESMGSTMASMPHYMSRGVNEMTASGVETAVNGLMSMLLLTITGVEEIIIFFINVLTQTYLCLITLVISGSLHAAIKILDEASDFLNKTIGDIGDGISDLADGFQDKVNDFLEGINTVTSVFGGDVDIPKLDMDDSIKKLNDLKLPDSLDEDLQKLNKSIPTFDDVRNFTDTALRFPFEEVKKLINGSIDDFKFDRSLFPVPKKEALDFCSDSDGINSFFKNLASIMSSAKKIFLGVLIVAAILACVPMAWREIRKWRLMKERSLLIQKDAHDPMDVVYIVSRPYTSTAGLKVSTWFQHSRKQVLVRWVFAYATSTPALFVLCLGLAGLFSCACQAILLHALKKEVPAITDHVGQYAEKVVHSLTDASEQWAVSTNGVIDDANDGINEKVFGWVNDTSITVNDTLNTFVDTTSDVLEETFGGTILHDPIKEVLNCLIMLKIQGIQKGLTWVSEHAHVNFPKVRNDMFSNGAADSISAESSSSDSDSFLANPGDKTADKISSVIFRVIEVIESGIRTEAIISACVVLLWFIILLLAILRALTLAWRRDKMRGEGGVDASFHPPPPPGMEMTGFHNIPLNGNGNGSDDVPKYSTTPSARGIGNHSAGTGTATPCPSEADYQAQKLGYAGHRECETAVNKVSRVSSYAEVEYGLDVKRG